MKNAIVYKLLLIVSIILLSLFTSCRMIQNPESIKLVSTYTTRIRPTTKMEREKTPERVVKHIEEIQRTKTYDIFQTQEFIVYNGLKDQATVLNTYAEQDLQLADELRSKALKCSRAAQLLMDSSEMVTNKKEKKELVKRAEWLDIAFIKLIAVSDSIREVGRNSDAAWYSKRVEAELYVQSVDEKRYDQIMALYNILDIQNIKTVAMNENDDQK